MAPAPAVSFTAAVSAAARPSRTAARSRGPPRPKARRDTARAMSGALRSASRRSARSRSASTRKPTQSSRAWISLASRNGAARRLASSRAPAPVTVRSMAASRLPSLPPEVARTSSRLERLAASISSAALAPVRRGGRNTGCLPSCVRSTYLSSAPTAASSVRENEPKPPSSVTPSRALSPRSPETLSKCAFGSGVAAAPAISIHLRSSASASSPSVARISPGDRRTSSPGRSAPVVSPISHSPVEMSSEARATRSAEPSSAPSPPGARKIAVR